MSTPLEKKSALLTLIDHAQVGTQIKEVPIKIDGWDGNPVTLHCVEVLNFPDKDTEYLKTFKVFSHGLEIKEVKMGKTTQGKWRPE